MAAELPEIAQRLNDGEVRAVCRWLGRADGAEELARLIGGAARLDEQTRRALGGRLREIATFTLREAGEHE